MTILQLRIAVAAAETKSISAAAKNLGISQPNASSSLKLLEEEIGFLILSRSSTGTVLTKKGETFIEYARQMVEMSENVMNLRHADELYRLRLGSVNYYAAAEPFFALCAKHRNDSETDFIYQNVSVLEGIQALVRRELDIVTVPVMKHQLVGLISECEKQNITMTSICQIPAVIMMRSGHPAALDGRCRHITQGCDTMKDYPYIGIRNLAADYSPTGYNDSDFIQCSYKMFADDTNMRLRMIESTNGFSFGILSSQRVLSQYNLICFPVPGISLELFCLSRSGDSGRRENLEYMTILKGEMQQILENNKS